MINYNIFKIKYSLMTIKWMKNKDILGEKYLISLYLTMDLSIEYIILKPNKNINNLIRNEQKIRTQTSRKKKYRGPVQ